MRGGHGETSTRWDFGGASNLPELHEKIKPYFLRRTKTQVLTELPEKQRGSIVVEFTGDLRKQYDALRAELEASLEAGGKPGEHLAMIEKLKQFAALGKLDSAVDWVQDLLDNSDEKIIVFAHHKEVINHLMKAFGKTAVKISGDVPVNKRQDIVDKFQTDDSIRVFVGNIKAAGTGITLTAAGTVLFLEFAWVPGDMVQAEDRAYRIGQRNNVMVWHMVAENTIEADIVELLETKRQIADTIHDGNENATDNFSVEMELLKRIKAGG